MLKILIMENYVNWFEIPVSDFPRAKNFYSQVLEAEITEVEMMGSLMGMLPSDDRNVSGAIVKGDDYEPSKSGTLIYLNGQNNLTAMLDRVEEAGGTIILGKTPISDQFGYFGLFLDTEGNKMAIHSMN